MKEEGQVATSPFTESFGQWKNLKIVLLALFAIMSAQGAVWYTAFFYTQTFLDKFLKVDPATRHIPIVFVSALDERVDRLRDAQRAAQASDLPLGGAQCGVGRRSHRWRRRPATPRVRRSCCVASRSSSSPR
jgi:hypothetical protein